MKIALVTDAWHPQINGVVRALSETAAQAQRMGHEVLVVNSLGQRTVPCPTYREIRLTLRPYASVKRLLGDFRPDAVHIATEGPLGLAARFYCKRRRWDFTTSFHTRFPEYLAARAPVPLGLSYAFLRWFHGGAAHTMVSNPALAEDLRARGITRLALWSRGVDTTLFRPLPEAERHAILDLPRPVYAYFGRVAVEKNVEDFLRLQLPGSKVVIGDGPQAAELQSRYPDVHWLGMRQGEDLARHLAATDVMVFPSRTDTLGLVILEANACGVPVAAYPVVGPLATVRNGINGILDADLRTAALAALELSRESCRERAMVYDWAGCTREFLGNLVPARGRH